MIWDMLDVLPWFHVWGDSTLTCPLRLTADVGLLLSYPVLWSIMYRKGCQRISLQFHLLQLLVFVTRYLDIVAMDRSPFRLFMKVSYLLAALVTVVIVAISAVRAERQMPLWLAIAVSCFQLFTLSSIVNVLSNALKTDGDRTWIEYLWNVSYPLAAFAITFQLGLWVDQRESYERTRLSPSEKVYLALYEARLLYLPHWAIQHYAHGKSLDKVAVFSALLHVAVLAKGAFKYWRATAKEKDTVAMDIDEKEQLLVEKEVLIANVA